MKYLSILFFTINLIFTGQIFAQEFNLVGISVTHNPSVGLREPIRESNSNVDLDLTEFRAFFLAPMKLENGRTTLLGGLDYQYLGGPLNNLPSDRHVDANLHSIRGTMGFRHHLSDKWSLRALLMPTLASDFSGSLSSDAFTLQSSIIVQRVIHKDHRYGFGIAYTNGFGESKIIPVAQWYYQVENFDVYVVAPTQAAVRYHLDKFFVGFRIDLQGNEYELAVDERRSGLPSISSIRFSRYNVGPTIGWKMTDATRLQLSGGISVKRRLEAVTDVATIEDYSLKSGLFVKVNLFFGDYSK